MRWCSALAAIASFATGIGAAVPARAQSACIDPALAAPVFRTLRYEERHCDREPTPSDPWWFALKNLGEDPPRASFGGELRARAERLQPVRAELRDGTDDGYGYGRVLLHGDVALGERARVFGQIGFWEESGRRGGPAPTDEDRDVQQLFVEWGDARAGFVRAGRQEALYGSGRLIGIRHSPNIRLAFDGLRAAVPIGRAQVEVFHLRPVAIDPDGWDNRENSGERVAGAYVLAPRALGALSLDAYAFRFERAFQRYQNAAGREGRNLVGMRAHGALGRYSINVEGTLQRGRVGDARVRAWSLQSDTSWRASSDSPYAIGLKANLASGDEDATDDTVDTFQPIYAAPPYFMQSSLIFPANLGNLQPYVEWRGSRALTVTAELQFNWRLETADGYYQPPLVVQALDEEGHYLATQAGAALRWAARKDLLVEGWLSRLRASGPLERAGARDTTFVAAMLTYSF